MLEGHFFHNPDYMEYIRSLFHLHVALAEGWDETDEGEALRERMERPGSRLSSDEITSLSGISADFYSLTDEHRGDVLPMPVDVYTDLEPILQSWKSRDPHTALDLLRKHAGYIPAASLAYSRGRIWMEAAEHMIAAAFLQRASELEPSNANYRYLALHALSKANPASAIQMAQAILVNWDKHSPRLVLKSLDVLVQSIRAESNDRSHPELKSFIPIFRNSIFRFETSGEVDNDPSLLVSSINHLDFCEHHSV
jgi:hypothetical protein